jgi:hypothetical protein
MVLTRQKYGRHLFFWHSFLRGVAVSQAEETPASLLILSTGIISLPEFSFLHPCAHYVRRQMSRPVHLHSSSPERLPKSCDTENLC